MSSQKIIMIGGLPGSGKSFFAKELSTRIDAIHLSSDILRKELDSMGHYKKEEKEVVYEFLKSQLIKSIEAGRTAVIDTTFYRRKLRDDIVSIAKYNKIKSYFILTTASGDVIRARVSKKREDSEANFEVYKLIKSEFEPIKMDYLELATDEESMEDMMDKAFQYCNISLD